MKKITLFFTLLLAAYTFGQPTTAAPTPTQDAADVISVFSGSFTDISVSEFSTVWDNADVFDDTADGDAVKRYTLTGGAFIGIQLAGLNDLSTMENFHVDVWVDALDAGDVLLPKLANFANGTGNPTSNEVEFTYAFNNMTEQGVWVSIDVALSSFNIVSGGSSDISDVFQIVFGSSGTLAGTTVYMDNLYFWKTSVDPNVDASLSDLQVDGNTVDGFSPSTLDYNVELTSGTTTVPTVTATATQDGMGSSNVSVTPAGSLPGTTSVLVTAPDGTTQQTYTINFTVASSGPSTGAPIPPNREVSAVASIFSDVYADIAVSEFSTVWDNADVVDEMAGGNAVKKYTLTGGAFIGIQLTGLNDLSSFTHFHVDVWIDNIDAGDVLLPKIANFANGTGSSVTNEIEFTKAFAPTEGGMWVSIDEPLSSFNVVSGGSSDISDVFQIVFGSSGTLAGAELYMDNLYFHNNTTLSINDKVLNNFKAYPNPTQDSWTFKGNSQIESIRVLDILGKEVMVLSPNTNETTIDGTDLKSGIYFAQVKTLLGVDSVKLIKQ